MNHLRSLRAVHLSFIVVVILGMLGTGCQSTPRTETEKVQILFEGFRLVMVDDWPPDKSLTDIDRASFEAKHPIEPGFVPGRVYIFRKSNTHSNDRLAIELLPKRLERIGARVTKAPKSARELGYRYVGGPMYLIHFEQDGHTGVLFNRVHSGERDSDNWEELVFAFRLKE